MSNDDNYTGVLLEEIRDQNKAVLEAVGQIQDTMGTLATKDELQAVANDIKTIKKVLTETNKDVSLLDARLSTVEHTLSRAV